MYAYLSHHPHLDLVVSIALFIASIVTSAAILFFAIGLVVERGNIREVFRTLGIPFPYHLPNPRFWFYNRQVKAGVQRWRKFHDHWMRSGWSAYDPKAYQRALATVKKLAPEAYIGMDDMLYGRGDLIKAHSQYAQGKCCSNTFHSKDNNIPTIERSLNNYLWVKLFRDRFDRRPNTTKWGAYYDGIHH